ncbi:MAG: hypothetical protein JO022_02115, partial [Acidobacteriaceae bacterium]|nr:hypothetical protein [Acidobacteriaceae bacterium]
YPTGTANPPSQNIGLTSSSATPFTVSFTPTSSWLTVTPTNGTTNAGGAATNLSVQVSPGSLTPASYTGDVAITANGSTQHVAVTLNVTSQAGLQVNPSSVSFVYQVGSSTQPTQQQVNVTSTGNPIGFTATAAGTGGPNFVVVSPTSGTTPATLNLSVDPTVLSTLASGTYNATVTLTNTSTSTAAGTIPVTLVVSPSGSAVLSASQASLNFVYKLNGALPLPQNINIISSASPLNYTVSTSSSNCSGFVSAFPPAGTTPSSITLNVTPPQVATTCNGTVTITAPGAANVLSIPVTLVVSSSATLAANPTALTATLQPGASTSQSLAITSTDATVPLSFNTTFTPAAGGPNWLSLPATGTTPATLTVTINAQALTAGTYNGTITIQPTSAGATALTIPVSLVVGTSAVAAALPTSLSFTQSANGAAPASQTISLSSSVAGLAFSASAAVQSGASNWLAVTPASGSTPASVAVNVNGAGLTPGTYNGTVSFAIPNAANTPVTVPVTLTITAASTLSATPAILNFTYSAGGAAPPSQTVQVGNSTGSASFAVSTTSTPAGLLTATPSSGTTPTTISVGLLPAVLAGLTPGTYSGTVNLSSTSAGTQSITVNVTVNAAAPPSIGAIVNSASQVAGSVAPGELITIYGTNLGPAAPVSFTIVNGTVATTLGGTQVLFDSVAAPLIYVSATQINAIVPYELAGRAATNVTITSASGNSIALLQNVADTVPAIFSANQTGNGQGAILNANNSANSSVNPAAAGTVIQIYATGEGTLNPFVPTGSVTGITPPFPKPAGAVSVTIGGQPATIQFAGEAPSLVSGVLQVNAVIPAGLSGPQPVVLTVGNGSNSQQAITVAVQ